jgi:hypothetical protein
MTRIELIDLDGEEADGTPIYGSYPQYPECPFAFKRKGCTWTQEPKKIPVIFCGKGGCVFKGIVHRGTCIDHIKENRCPYNIRDGDAIEFIDGSILQTTLVGKTPAQPREID